MGQPMATIYSTSEAGYELIQRFEGCEKRLPDNRLKAYKIGADPWTIGWGQTGQMPDGRKVEDGLIITQEEADTALQYFVRAVVDPLVRKHFVCRSQAEHDACASFVYNINHSRLERGDYSLPSLINLKARDPEAITNKWLQYVATPGFENGLYRRRLAECLMFMGLSWNAPAVWGYISTAIYKRGGVKQPTDPWFIIDVAQALEETPKTEDQVTADLNNAQLEKLGGKVGQTVATPRPPPPAKPKAAAKEKVAPPAVAVDPELPPKPMEQSATYKAVSRADRGKETAIIGTITGTGLTAAAANAERVGTVIEKFKPETFLVMAAMFGLFLIVMGGLMWWSGRNEAYHRRQHTQDAKY
jgi:GH24 family phage-related lysozyme (muramidase)